VMAYHSQQVLLMRSDQERHLDSVLNRKNPQAAFNNSVIRSHLQQCTTDNLIFILVATPVEEVGRDHDFDWAVVEPSSYRSIIQLAGRILRHRGIAPQGANMALLQYNLKALKQQGVAFYRPGYESGDLRLVTHDLNELIPGEHLARIDALPRIRRNPEPMPNNNLADLEQESIHRLLSEYLAEGPQSLQGWLTECWWLTALPQRLSPFREQDSQQNLYLIPDGIGDLEFVEKTSQGQIIPIEKKYKIGHDSSYQQWQSRLWLYRDYQELLEHQAEQRGISLRQAALRFGEISIRIDEKEIQSGQGFVYSSQLGLWKQAGND